jgi:hypothetical protein
MKNLSKIFHTLHPFFLFITLYQLRNRLHHTLDSSQVTGVFPTLFSLTRRNTFTHPSVSFGSKFVRAHFFFNLSPSRLVGGFGGASAIFVSTLVIAARNVATPLMARVSDRSHQHPPPFDRRPSAFFHAVRAHSSLCVARGCFLRFIE